MQKNIKNWENLEQTVLKIGLLPYFRNKIEGFSVEENVPEVLLWDIDNGPWEWKGLVLRDMKVAYGKFFDKRAGYISLEWLPHFINYRRSRYFIAPDSAEAEILSVLREHESLLSKELKVICGYVQPRTPRKSANPFENIDKTPKQSGSKTDSRFESAVTRLQMAGYVTIADFEYLYDRQGNRYGWGVARYTTPEALYEIKQANCSPTDSFKTLVENLRKNFPEMNPIKIHRLLG